jgi:2-methylcitrate dehydratase PrpD
MTVTQGMADYIFRTNYSDIPAVILNKARECILDSIGVALYGYNFAASQIALEVTTESGNAEGPCSILVEGVKVAPYLASFVNGVMAHVADFDDTLFVLRGHPSCVLMPAALAACESLDRSGKDFLTAFVIGSEIEGKMGKVMAWQHYEAGWHSTGTFGTIGAAAAASKGLGLDRDEIANALGIAASSASGLRVNFGTMTKSYNAGHAAMAGVLAAQLAKRGFDASSHVLEGDIGFSKLFGCNGDVFLVIRDLGVDYALKGISLKPYPSCAGTHSAVEAILNIKGRLNPEIKKIAEIQVMVHPSAFNILFHHNPKDTLEAKFSMEYCICAALVFNQLGIAQFEEECIFDPTVKDLMRRVKMIVDSEMEDVSRKHGVLAPVRVKMKLHGGEEVCETVWEPRGSPSNPMSQDEIRAKFRECADRSLPDEKVELALEIIKKLDHLKNISQLTSILSS